MSNLEMKPLVSIIVPVYNAAPWLRRCLDSLVYQTLENIEIIAVNKGSIDESWEILKEYQIDFPHKVFIANIEASNGPGAGRNYGLKHARADYIAFADSDDYFNYNAMELLYNQAQQEDYDMVCCASYDVKGTSYNKTRILQATDSKSMIRNASMVFWNKLVKKELFDIVGLVPENIVFEDIAYVSTLISYAKKIGYVDEPLYYYILRDDSGVNDLKSDRILHSLKAYEIAIKNCNSEVREELIASIVHRILYDLHTARWTFADKFIEYIQKNQKLFNVSTLAPKDEEDLKRIFKLNYEAMPKVIYVNGFEKVNETWIEYVKENAFDYDTQVIILDEKNCDLNKYAILKTAYDKKDYATVAEYFALLHIYKHGGVYLTENIQLINYLNCLRYKRAVFSYLDNTTFSSEIFSGIRGSAVIGAILKTYENNYNSSFSDRVENILRGQQGLILNAHENFLSNEISVYTPEVMVTGMGGNMNICRHTFRDKIDSEDYMVIKKSVFEMMMEK